MQIHRIKILSRYFRQVASGDKPFEFRRNDRGYRAGDLVVLDEIGTNDDGETIYTGRSIVVLIKQVWELGELLEKLDGWCVFTFEVLYRKLVL